MLPVYLDSAPPYFPGGSSRFQSDLQTIYVQCPKEELFANSVHSKEDLPPIATVKGSKWYEHSQSLGSIFTPGPFDVICARGKAAWNHSGNKRFRALVTDSTQAYAEAKSKAERSVVVSDILVSVRSKDAGFVKMEKDGQWIEVGNLLAREKAGQILRNALSSEYRSSIVSKKRRRKDTQAKSVMSLHGVMQSNIYIRQSMDTIKQGAALVAENDSFVSDDELMALFEQAQSNMLAHIKADTGLVDSFLQAEVTSCLVMNDDDASSDSDGDVEMTAV
jgi:hypothetical protein